MSFELGNSTTVDLDGTNLIAQAGLDKTWVDLGLSVEDTSKVGYEAIADAKRGKKKSVEVFDLLFGNGWSLNAAGEGGLT